MKFRTRHSVANVLTLDDGTDVDLDFEPVGDPLVHQEGDHLVVAYNVHDSDAENPMTSCDCQGTIITGRGAGGRNGLITDDDDAIKSHLRVNGSRWYDAYPDIDMGLYGRPKVSCRDLAAQQVYDELVKDPDDVDELRKSLHLPALGLRSRQIHWLKSDEGQKLTQRDLGDENSYYVERVEALAVEYFRKHWREVVSPYVVPLSYSDYGYDTSISVADWDGYHEDLPNAIWVADKGAIENITPMPEGVKVEYRGACGSTTDPIHAVVLHNGVEVFDTGVGTGNSYGAALRYIKENFPAPNLEDVRRAAERYAEGVVEEYASWASGDVYGCVVQTFKREGDAWEEVDNDACWGFIGSEYAEEALKSEYFNPAVAGLKEKSDAV